MDRVASMLIRFSLPTDFASPRDQRMGCLWVLHRPHGISLV